MVTHCFSDPRWELTEVEPLFCARHDRIAHGNHPGSHCPRHLEALRYKQTPFTSASLHAGIRRFVGRGQPRSPMRISGFFAGQLAYLRYDGAGDFRPGLVRAGLARELALARRLGAASTRSQRNRPAGKTTGIQRNRGWVVKNSLADNSGTSRRKSASGIR